MAAILSQVHVLLGNRAALSWLRLPARFAPLVQWSFSGRSAVQCDGDHRPALADMGSRPFIARVSGTSGPGIHGGSPAAEWQAGDVHCDCRDCLLGAAEYPLLAI